MSNLEDRLTELETTLNEIVPKLETLKRQLDRIEQHTLIIGCQVGVQKLCRVPKN